MNEDQLVQLFHLAETEDPQQELWSHSPLAVSCNVEGRWATMGLNHSRDECEEEVSRSLSDEDDRWVREPRFEPELYSGHLREAER